MKQNGFQSTQPEWAATWSGYVRYCKSIFQSTQPEWAATINVAVPTHLYTDFNPRSPNGLRPAADEQKRRRTLFQSTQPEWAATAAEMIQGVWINISIHAARMGCDRTFCHEGIRLFYISIHAARMGCDTEGCFSLYNIMISIHAARMGCDSIRINCNYYLFYSYKSAKLIFLLN